MHIFSVNIIFHFHLYSWQPFSWESCSVTCGTGTETRRVICVVSNGQNLIKVDDAECSSKPKPPTEQECINPTQCPNPVVGVWVASSFSQVGCYMLIYSLFFILVTSKFDGKSTYSNLHPLSDPSELYILQ